MIRPYVQINGEVSAVGDRIRARLILQAMKAHGRTVSAPTCAFTTQGVRVYGFDRGGLEFKGRRDRHAASTYVSLSTGATGDTCAEAQSRRRPDRPVR